MKADIEETSSDGLGDIQNDIKLVKKVLNGELQAYSELVTLYEPKIRSFCFYMLGEKELSWDIAQETFLKAYKNLSSYKEQSKFSTWLFTIAKNTCIDHTRKKSFKKWFSVEDLAGDEKKTAELGTSDSRSSSPEASKLEAKDLVHKILNKLSDEQKSLLILKEHEGFSVKEISDVFNSTEDSIKSKLKRARIKAKDIREELLND